MEIGSEFNLRLETLTPTQDNIYNYLSGLNVIYLDSARSALRLLSRTLDDGDILIPEYICDSVIDCFPIERIKFYKLDCDMQINVNELEEQISDNTSVLYVMNYFGVLQSPENLSFLAEQKSKFRFTIIEDTTHSIFSKPITIGDYAIASIRKWFPIPDGGILYSNLPLTKFNTTKLCTNTDIPKVYGMLLKTLYLDNVADFNKLYRDIFQKAETFMDHNEEIKSISEISTFLLKCINVTRIIKKRADNYSYLAQELSALSTIEPLIEENDQCFFTFPILVSNRNDVRKFLEDNKIYCAVHWPLRNAIFRNIKFAEYLSQNLISLPIDQRYGLKEMEYIVKVIRKYKGVL